MNSTWRQKKNQGLYYPTTKPGGKKRVGSCIKYRINLLFSENFLSRRVRQVAVRWLRNVLTTVLGWIGRRQGEEKIMTALRITVILFRRSFGGRILLVMVVVQRRSKKNSKTFTFEAIKKFFQNVENSLILLRFGWGSKFRTTKYRTTDISKF